MPPAPTARLDSAEIVKTIGLFFEPEDVFEVRVLGVGGQGARTRTMAGYFHGRKAPAVVRALGQLPSWEGVYVTLNPVDPSMYALGASRLQEANTTAKDSDVSERRHILIDFDPIRRSGISSTEEEQQAALDRAVQVRDYLTQDLGLPEPILASSGNGAHLVFKTTLPSSTDIVEKVLAALDVLFSDDRVHVDTGVHNPGRITKLYGTMACKGDSIPERPHRMARIISAPSALTAVASDKLEELASLGGAEEEGSACGPGESAPDNLTPRRSFNVAALLERCGIGVHHEAPWRGGTKWVLNGCPMDASHGVDKAAYVLQFPSGAISAGCHHERCTWGWRELRERYEPRPVAGPTVTHSVADSPRVFSRGGLVPGARVRAHDRGNVGTILTVSADGATVEVLFVSREGTSATKIMSVSEVAPISGGASSSGTPRTYELLDVDVILRGGSPEYLVDGILDLGNLCVLYGEPASFKTFLALDLALRVAVGAPWHMNQHRTRRSLVVYVMAEGQVGLRLRMSAWLRVVWAVLSEDPENDMQSLYEEIRSRFFAFDDAVPLIDGQEVEGFVTALERLAEKVGEKPGLVVLDTLARCSLGGDENSSRDMGLMVEACNLIRRRTGAAVLLIHHTGKDKELERGSSALRAAADSMLKVTRTDPLDDAVGRVRVTIEKRKDGAGEADIEFDLVKVDLDPRADGTPVSSLVPAAATARVASTEGGNGWHGRRRRNLTTSEQEMRVLAELAMTVHQAGAAATVLREGSGVPKSSVYKRLNALVNRGLVEIIPRGGASIYRITESGRRLVSPVSRQSPETSGGAGHPQSPQSPHPLIKGVETRPETETLGQGIVEVDGPVRDSAFGGGTCS